MGRDTLKTTEEWNKLGFRIRKGERHHSRNQLGTCVFSIDQVCKRQRSFGYDSPYEEDDDYDEGMSGYDFGGDW